MEGGACLIFGIGSFNSFLSIYMYWSYITQQKKANNRSSDSLQKKSILVDFSFAQPMGKKKI